jgi:hypothetical protein
LICAHLRGHPNGRTPAILSRAFGLHESHHFASSKTRFLPFEALVDETGSNLAETTRCAYLSSGRDLLRPEDKLAQGVVVFAGPDFKASSAERQTLAAHLLGKTPPNLGPLHQMVVLAKAPIETRLPFS